MWFLNMLKYIYANNLSELAADNNENIRIEGAVKELAGGIPFDYKDKYSKYFTKEYRKKMIDRIYDHPSEGEYEIEKSKAYWYKYVTI